MIAVYGGTFSPFGSHHLQAISQVAESQLFSKVVVVPAIAHALKSTEVPWEHRYHMAVLGTNDIRFPHGVRVTVSDAEFRMLREQPTPIYTIDVLRHFQRMNDKADYRFVIGPDIPGELDRWHQAERIQEDFGFFELPELGIHATDIRTMIAQGDSAWEGHVPPPVARYIKMHGLYGASQ
jgi:nicotinic acid mononucleotide adenylyltransferase